MNIQGTSKLAEAIWHARFGNRNVDEETSVQIWLCAEKNIGAYEQAQQEPSYVLDGLIRGIATEPFDTDEETFFVLGNTHQDIADEAYKLWAEDERGKWYIDEPAIYWFTAESILHRGTEE